MTTLSSTPWGEHLRVAMTMGVSPAVFWSLSLREWRLLTDETGQTGLRTAELASLMAAFPDKEIHNGKSGG